MDSTQDHPQKSDLLNKKRQNSASKNIPENPLQKNKKPKLESNQKNKSFRIIEPYRSLGIYTDNNKIYFFKRGIDRFMLTSNKYSFIVYNLEKLRIERISPPLEKPINALYPYKTKIFTGVGNKVQLWEKIHVIKEFNGNIDDPNDIIKQIMTFENTLLFITKKGDLFIYEIHSGELIAKIEKNIDYFIHPIAYINKILFSQKSERYEEELDKYEPNLILYDINEEKEIINYKEFFGDKKSKINLFEQSPIIDIISISFNDGDIFLFNLKKNKIILKLQSQYKITSMAFSSCNSMAHSLLVTGCDNGIINIWDLNKKSIHYTLNNDFTNISNIIFLPEEPIMVVTSENDNSIKMYKFEKNTSIPQLLKFRTGHNSSPIHLKFYGESANEESIQILSCDKNNLRNISLLSEQISKEFSSKKFNNSIRKHKITNFDFNEFRERDWGNIALIISDYERPIIYSYENSCINDIQPKLKTKNTFVSCVCISICGNFGFCGFKNGNIEKFNMQSGQSRWVLERAHGIGNEITNLKSDGLNSMLISISKNEKKIKFWEILDHSLIKEFIIDSFPRQIEINRDSDLICVALENNYINIYDKSQLALVRKFNILLNNKNNKEEDYIINDIDISKDSNWLLCITNKDKSLKIYDIISTNLIEWVQFDKTPLAMNLSPNSLYIAMSFEEEKGIYLYINRTLFVDLEDIENVVEPVHCTLAAFKAKMLKQRDEHELNDINYNIKDNNEKDNDNSEREKFVEIPEENNELISLSKENNIKYKILNDIELLQERNAPKIKEKKKEQAPFFLFNINDVIEGQLPTKESDNKNQSNEEESPEFLNLLKNYSHFNNEKKITEKKFIHSFHKKNITEKESTIKIKSEENKEGYILSQLLIGFKNKKIKSNEITKFLNKLNPYISDLEIRSLDPLFTLGGENYLLLFTEYILNEFKESNNNFEMLQAYLNRFVKIYSDDIVNDKEIKNNLEKINEINKNKFDELENIFNSTMCLVSHFGNIQI